MPHPSNYKRRLDPALVRPGRVDTEVEFKHASQVVSGELFKVFYPTEGAFPIKRLKAGESLLMQNGHEPPDKACTHVTAEEINSLANSFAAAIPESEFSPAEIQGKIDRYGKKGQDKRLT